MAGERISAQAMLGEAFAAIKREWEPFILLAALFAILTILLFWPFLESYGKLLIMDLGDEGASRLILEEWNKNAWYLALIIVPYSLLIYGLTMVWSRISVLGRGAALIGGVPVFLKRTLWSFWRYLCAVGWMILFVIGFGILIGLVVVFGGASIEGGRVETIPALALVLIIPLYIVLFLGVLGILVLFGLSLHGEARDFHFPIHRSFKAMRGNLLRALGLLTLVTLVLEVIVGIAFALFLAVLIQASGWAMLLALFLLLMGSAAIQLLWVSYGAAYATRAVPELKT